MAQGTSSTTKYVLIGLGIALGLGVCGVGSCLVVMGGGAFWAYEQMDAPAREAKAFFEAVSRDDAQGALSHASKSFRARMDEARLRAAVAKHPGLSKISDVSLPQRAVQNGRAQVAGMVTSTEAQTGVEVELVQEGEAWRVDAVRIAGTPLE